MKHSLFASALVGGMVAPLYDSIWEFSIIAAISCLLATLIYFVADVLGEWKKGK